MHLTGYGLNSDRFRSFKQKLKRIPQSYSNNFRQSLMFQKSLGCVTNSRGTLHVAFHVSQTMFNVFRILLSWTGHVFNWKKRLKGIGLFRFGEGNDVHVVRGNRTLSSWCNYLWWTVAREERFVFKKSIREQSFLNW